MSITTKEFPPEFYNQFFCKDTFARMAGLNVMPSVIDSSELGNICGCTDLGNQGKEEREMINEK